MGTRKASSLTRRKAAEGLVSMASGGARVNSGPPPDPNALVRDRKADKDGWTTLPAGGRKGRTPPWPLAKLGQPGVGASPREATIWTAIWRTPQAVAWERLGLHHDAAIYVRLLVAGERGNVSAITEMRQWSDRLGLNPAAMLRNRWRVAADEVAAKRSERPAAPTAAPTSARERLKAISGGES